MRLEEKINYQLNKYPIVKKLVKKLFQLAMYTVSHKMKSEGEIIRVSPDDPKHEYFFGYYDKTPWDATDRYILCMRANDTWSDVSPKEIADILLIDTAKAENDPQHIRKIAETKAWNVQQGCMLQWLGPDFSSRILYNDYRDGNYCAVILTLKTMEEKVISAPVSTVAMNGTFALTLDFSRLYNLCPGYGYYNVPERTEGSFLPDATAVWKVDLETGDINALLSYKDFAYLQPRPEMQKAGSVHKVNHLMISPNGKRFMVLYRWFNGQRKYTRLVTCNTDGTDMYVLSDGDMVSHCFWKNNTNILAFENKKTTGPGYYLMEDKTRNYIRCWPQFSSDGHPSYSPDGKFIVTDSYPNSTRVASISLMDGDERKREHTVIARVFAPFRYDNDTRCDLHPRWNHQGNKICFDSVFEGHRGMYVVDISTQLTPNLSFSDTIKKSENHTTAPKYSIVTPMFNSFHLMKKYFESLERQTMNDFEVILVDDCSTDDSYENACQYAKETSIRLSVYKTEINAGPGKARNIGMEQAMGDWITFIDNDDWVDTDMLEKVERVIAANDVNCIICDYYITDGKKHKAAHSMYKGEKGVIPLAKCIASVRNHTFGKFYKLAKCKERNVRFPELRRCEDIAFVCRAIDACGSIYYMKEPMFYYFQRQTSLSNSKKMGESDLIKAFEILEGALSIKYPEEMKEKSVPDLLYSGLLIMCKAGKTSKEIKEYINNYEGKYPNWYKCGVLKQLGKAKLLFLMSARFRQVMLLKQFAYLHSRLIGQI